MAEYCPFLNRADERCSGHFNLDGLEQAFAHCFGEFEACPHHDELSREAGAEDVNERSSHRNSIVALTISAGKRERLAAAA